MWDLPGLNEKDMTREEFYKAVQVPRNVPALIYSRGLSFTCSVRLRDASFTCPIHLRYTSFT
jgi:hypothetical protein